MKDFRSLSAPFLIFMIGIGLGLLVSFVCDFLFSLSDKAILKCMALAWQISCSLSIMHALIVIKSSDCPRAFGFPLNYEIAVFFILGMLYPLLW